MRRNSLEINGLSFQVRALKSNKTGDCKKNREHKSVNYIGPNQNEALTSHPKEIGNILNKYFATDRCKLASIIPQAKNLF